MKIVVVYESMFGNTRTIAEAVAEGLRDAGKVSCGTVDEISPDEVGDAVLIAAGGPTHAHGMARPNAHRSLAKGGPSDKHGPVLPGQESLRGWLERIPQGDAKVAAFDTRFEKPVLITGSAAKKIAGRFRRKGYPIVGMRSFFVQTAGGPLAYGERERATAWGRELAANIMPALSAQATWENGRR